jgi:hypothetical protein
MRVCGGKRLERTGNPVGATLAAHTNSIHDICIAFLAFYPDHALRCAADERCHGSGNPGSIAQLIVVGRSTDLNNWSQAGGVALQLAN